MKDTHLLTKKYWDNSSYRYMSFDFQTYIYVLSVLYAVHVY